MSNVHGLQDEPPRELKRRTKSRRGVHIDDDAAAYSLSALEPTDHAQVERHLQSCPRCARLVEAHHRTVRFLPFLAPLAQPRPEAKAALFARIAATQYPPPLATLPPSRPATVDSSVAIARNDAAGTKRRWRPGPLIMRPSMIASLVLALALVSIWAFDIGTPTGTRLSDQQQEIARQSSESGYISTGLNADTGDGEDTLGDGHAISDALPDTTEAPISRNVSAPSSRIGDGLLSATGLRVDVGQSPLPANPLGVNALLSIRGISIPA